MGSFVKNLTKVLAENEQITNNAFAERQAAIEERDQAMEQIASSILELQALRIKDKNSQDLIQSMQLNMQKLKDNQSRTIIQPSTIINKGIFSNSNRETIFTVGLDKNTQSWSNEKLSNSLDTLGKTLSKGFNIGATQTRKIE